MSNWKTYFTVHAKRKPRKEVVAAIAYCHTKNHALDLGAGTLVDTKFLLDSGFAKVDAVESAEEVSDIAKEITDPRFTLYQVRFQGFVCVPNTYDFVTAQYSLPFYGKEGFGDFIEKIKTTLVSGGVFSGQLFGNRDGWNTSDTTQVFQTKNEALAFFTDMEVILFEEKEYDGDTAAKNTKHWHLFEFIVRKK